MTLDDKPTEVEVIQVNRKPLFFALSSLGVLGIIFLAIFLSYNHHYNVETRSLCDTAIIKHTEAETLNNNAVKVLDETLKNVSSEHAKWVESDNGALIYADSLKILDSNAVETSTVTCETRDEAKAINESIKSINDKTSTLIKADENIYSSINVFVLDKVNQKAIKASDDLKAAMKKVDSVVATIKENVNELAATEKGQMLLNESDSLYAKVNNLNTELRAFNIADIVAVEENTKAVNKLKNEVNDYVKNSSDVIKVYDAKAIVKGKQP